MAQNGAKTSKFEWTAQREKAAALLANDDASDDNISAELNIGRRTLTRWKTHPDFAARIQSYLQAARDSIRANGIAIIENRVRHLQRRHDLLNKVISERAAAEDMQEVPGGKTGLMVHNVKTVGAGDNAERVDLYEVDTGLLKELREHEMQAAKELGQWQDKVDHTSGGKPLTVKVLNGVSMDDL